MSTVSNTKRTIERAQLRAEIASPAHPPCYYCGHPVNKVVCWPPVCRACDDLPGWEAL